MHINDGLCDSKDTCFLKPLCPVTNCFKLMISFDINRRYPDWDELNDLEFTSEALAQWQHLHRDPFFGLPRVNAWILRDYLYSRDVVEDPEHFCWQYDYLLPEHNVSFYLYVGGGEAAPYQEQREFFREFIARFDEFKSACDKRLLEMWGKCQPVIPNEARTDIEMTLCQPIEGKVEWWLDFYTMISQDFSCHAKGRGQEITFIRLGWG